MTTEREEALRHYPDAIWFVGDPCPVGTKVRLGRGFGVIVGVYPGTLGQRRHSDCPNCTCIVGAGACAGWWLVESINPGPDGDGLWMRDAPNKPLATIQYPPALERV
jgi:hypothetical protein